MVCWGDNGLGQAPPVPSLDRFTKVSGPCGLRTDGRIICWGLLNALF